MTAIFIAVKLFVVRPLAEYTAIMAAGIRL